MARATDGAWRRRLLLIAAHATDGNNTLEMGRNWVGGGVERIPVFFHLQTAFHYVVVLVSATTCALVVMRPSLPLPSRLPLDLDMGNSTLASADMRHTLPNSTWARFATLERLARRWEGGRVGAREILNSSKPRLQRLSLLVLLGYPNPACDRHSHSCCVFLHSCLSHTRYCIIAMSSVQHSTATRLAS